MIDWIQTHIPPWVYIAIIVHLVVLGSVAYLILLERKIASWVQDRIGPNRVGLGFGIIPVLKDMHMFGLGQPLADGLKFILKEDYRPKNTDKVLFSLAPVIMIIVIIISIAVIPWGGVKGSAERVNVAAGQSVVAAAAPLLPTHHEIVSATTVVDG
jgi:NADH-quinone oxidoreductase subunit H